MKRFAEFMEAWEDSPATDTHQTRYHVLLTKHWNEAKKRGHLDPEHYEGKRIWTSRHPMKHYDQKFGDGRPGLEHDETEVAITLHKRHFHEPPGGGSADRVTKIKVPLKHVKEVENERRAPRTDNSTVASRAGLK
jgi:hypothetical protein